MCDADSERVTAWVGRLRGASAVAKCRGARSENKLALAELEKKEIFISIEAQEQGDQWRTGISVLMAAFLVVLGFLDLAFVTGKVPYVAVPQNQWLQALPGRAVLLASPLIVLVSDAWDYFFGPPERGIHNHIILAALLVVAVVMALTTTFGGKWRS